MMGKNIYNLIGGSVMRTRITWLMVLILWPAVASAREWTDNTGRYHTNGKLMARMGNSIWLEKTDGQPVVVPFDKLCAADRAYLVETLGADPAAPIAPTVNPERAQWSQATLTNGRFKLTGMQDDIVEEEDPHARPRKYIYHGCGVTAHLARTPSPSPGIGTVAYWLGGWHRLDGLESAAAQPHYYVFRVVVAGNNYSYWAFGKHTYGCGSYPVYVWNGAWILKAWTNRERVY